MTPSQAPYYEIPTEGRYCLDFNEDKVCDVDFLDGKVIVFERKQRLIATNDSDNNNNDNDIKYCDGQSAPQYPDSCYDRKDLPEDSKYDDDAKTANCGGVACTPTEKENSWVDGEEPEANNFL